MGEMGTDILKIRFIGQKNLAMLTRTPKTVNALADIVSRGKIKYALVNIL